MERAEAEAILDGDRETAVALLLQLVGLVAANQRLVEANERLEARVVELERRLNRNSRNSSLPPSQDPPSAPARPAGKGSGRKRGGQHGHEGRYRRLLAPERVDEIVEHWPDRCGSCAHEFAAGELVDAEEPSRRQVAELPPIAVRVTEHRLHRVCCSRCAAVTAAEQPAETRWAFGPRLQRLLERLDPPLPPERHVRRRQPAEPDEHVDAADRLLLVQRGLVRPDDAPLEIPRCVRHARAIVAPSRRRRRFHCVVHPSLTELVTHESLRRLAGMRSFERGEEYLATGAVGSLRSDESSIRAGVQGTERYPVRLELAGGGLAGSCTCPVGRDGLFCKHCVAVGLAWLAQASDLAEPAAVPTRSELRDRLAALGAVALADLLIEEALDDEYLHARLLALTSGTSGDAAARFRQLEHAFDVAVDPGGFVAWNEAYGFAQALEEIVAAAEQQLGEGHDAEIVAFCEHALRRSEAAHDYVDDSNGELGSVRERLQELHLLACRTSSPEPRELAERLFRWELEGEWDTFFGALERYGDVLGERGIARYRELAEAAWTQERELGPGSDHAWGSRRYRIARVMEEIARADGDIDALVAVLARDRSSPHRYLLVAEELLAAGRTGEATEWAEHGLAAFDERGDPRLVDFVCERYLESGRREPAIQLAWETLERAPRADAYKRLATLAKRDGVWEAWRERAREAVRMGTDSSRGHDRSELVAALLWEGDDEQGWREAKEAGCRRDLWLALARAREREHPADALEVYVAQIEPAIRASDNHTYTGAVEWLEQARTTFGRLEQEDAFDEFVRDIRGRHRAKRNLIKRLDERGWARPAATGAVHS